VTVVVFIGQLLGNGWQQAAGIIPANITGRPPVEQIFPAWLTLFSYQFLHTGAGHLLTNAMCLWVFGTFAEPLMGARRFTLVYLVFGVVTGLVIVALIPHWTRPVVGASGSLSGILGTVLALRFTEKTSRLTVLEAIPPLAVAMWWLTRTEPPEPDRASSVAWHLIPFLLAWYSTRFWARFHRNGI
jgi:membrane associated rhomboid family serine protease